MVEDVFGILGTTLAGTFHVEEVIAEGGFGVVYRAEHVAFRAPVALKCLKIPGTISPSQSEQFVENFREEAEILFHLSAQIPEVVRPLHADAMTLEDGTFVPYIAMEWIDGKPLDSIIILREQDGLAPLNMRKCLKMLSPIAHALNKAHRFQVPGGAVVSVTHCDLKPENIVVTEKDNPVRAKILDFGIAKARDSMRQNVGRITDSEDSRPFTPSYGAPEQWVPKRFGQTGPWTDVWGLALTLVECLTGRPPIDGDMHAMMGTCLDQTRRPTPGTEGITLGEDVERAFYQALAVDPRERYQDVEEFWTALEDAEGVPSTFERARSRRARPTYDYDEESISDAAEEFAGLEMEEGADDFGEAGYDASKDAYPAPSTPVIPDLETPASARQSKRKVSRSSLEAVIDDPDDVGGELRALDSQPLDSPPLHSPPRGAASPASGGFPSSDDFVGEELDLPAGPPSGPRHGSIDLDLDRSIPAPAPSRPRAAVTSGSLSQSELSRSGSHPALTRSGTHSAMASSRVNAPRIMDPTAMDTVTDHEPTVMDRLKKPLMIFGAALVVIVADVILGKVLEGPVALGPVRLRYIGAALAAVAIVVGLLSLLGDPDE